MEENTNISKVYEPKSVEDKWYSYWLEQDLFHCDIVEGVKPFTVVIPPPNVTGQLHMGHALDETLQDTLVRYKRMTGIPTLWIPGTDHAGIATEKKVKDWIGEEGLTKFDIGREAFLEKAWEWKRQYGGRIQNQLKKIGASCDWSRERFTMDEGLSKAVREVFVNLYEKGLIYRSDYIVNWCPVCQTTLSDIETEYEEEPSFLWHLKYPVKDSEEYVIVATTRPETMLGDTAVAVNPEDERYTHLVGKTIVLPLVGREIPIIADSYVDKEFGTGAVKVTPFHDPNDFEMGLRHDLPFVQVIDFEGNMTKEALQYEGLSAKECREAIVKDLEKMGALVKTEPHAHSVGKCYRCGSTIEPLVSTQWFVKMEPLAKPALKAVEEGEVRFIPERFTKTYTHWMENIKDWCISRQLWWGHRIPAWYCSDCGKMTVSKTDIDTCPHCGSKNVKQDEDVLDTWFSSALWPFSTLGFPEKTADLKYFYPTSVLVTGYDIIFFWVARMIFSGIEHMGQVPFKDVFIHGLVRDEQGRKMSKSLGNGIDPLEVIDEYGTDTLRFSLITGNAPGNDIRFQWDKVRSSRSFANKIWNASRFILMNLDESITGNLEGLDLLTADKWILNELNTVIGEVTGNIERYELGLAAQKLYDFIWTEYCDWYIELTKSRLYGNDQEAKKTALNVLVYVLRQTLELLHPFMPFITEEIWQHLPHEGISIVVADWPKSKEELRFEQEKEVMEVYMETIRSIRNLRSGLNVPNSKKAPVYLAVSGEKEEKLYEGITQYLLDLASASEVKVVRTKEGLPEKVVTAMVTGAEILLPLEDLVDFEKEKERLLKEKEKLEKEVKRAEGKLNNPSFVAKAPEKLVAEEKEKLKDYQEKLQKVAERLGALEA